MAPIVGLILSHETLVHQPVFFSLCNSHNALPRIAFDQPVIFRLSLCSFHKAFRSKACHKLAAMTDCDNRSLKFEPFVYSKIRNKPPWDPLEFLNARSRRFARSPRKKGLVSAEKLFAKQKIRTDWSKKKGAVLHPNQQVPYPH